MLWPELQSWDVGEPRLKPRHLTAALGLWAILSASDPSHLLRQVAGEGWFSGAAAGRAEWEVLSCRSTHT